VAKPVTGRRYNEGSAMKDCYSPALQYDLVESMACRPWISHDHSLKPTFTRRSHRPDTKLRGAQPLTVKYCCKSIANPQKVATDSPSGVSVAFTLHPHQFETLVASCAGVQASRKLAR
jgi:hypothetical protein